MTDDKKGFDVSALLGKSVKAAENKGKAAQAAGGKTPLELAREAASENKANMKSPPARMEPMKEVTRGWLEEAGWDEIERRRKELELGPVIAAFPDDRGAKLALQQVIELPEGRSTRIKLREAQAIEEWTKKHNEGLQEQLRVKAEARKKARFETISIPDEDGNPLYTDRTTLKRMITSVFRGRDCMYTGEPGVGKTEFALAIGAVTERETFLMEMSGLSDPGQLEAQQQLEEVNGATVTVTKPSPLIQALEAASEGRKVVLVLDEFPRVTDPLIHNPLLLLLSHRRFTASISGKQYRVERENFVVVATANFEPGRNFSGNNRRGVDDAAMDRFRIIHVKRPPAHVIPDIVGARVDLSDLSPKAQENVLKAAQVLYSLADSPEKMRLVTVRSVLGVVDAWVSLDPTLYTLGETLMLELEHRPGTDQGVLSGFISNLELKGL